MTPQAIAMIIIAPFSGWLSDRFGIHIPTIAGMALISVSMFFMSQFDASTNYIQMIASLSISGAGFGFFNSANNLSILESVPANKIGLTSSLIATIRNFGRVSGVALAFLLLEIGLSSGAGPGNYVGASSLAFYMGTVIGIFTMIILFIRLKIKGR